MKIKIAKRSFSNSHKFVRITLGRLSILLFNYWIGLSHRYIEKVGKIVNIGFIKIVFD